MIKVLTNLVILLTCVGMIQTKSLKKSCLRSVSQEIREEFFYNFYLYIKKTGVKCTPTVKSRFSLVSSGFAGDVKIHHHSSWAQSGLQARGHSQIT